MSIIHIVGARPNFMKVAPVYNALKEKISRKQLLIHTGQHYDYNMNDIFFQQLCLPAPDINLEVGSGSHAFQTAKVMLRLEPILLEQEPELVIVYGDVNSTLAAALVCAKLNVPLAHVEAGLRSYDRSMPEEINRLLTDQAADLLFTPSQDANNNLVREGISKEKIHLVGNVMIDTLIRLLPSAMQKWETNVLRFEGLEIEKERYIIVTLHRPSNVDDPKILREIINTLLKISKIIPVVFSVHPRTRQRLNNLTNTDLNKQLFLTPPLSYLDFLALERFACAVITDSGGIQEETTYLGVPCLTLRENTERPLTITMGTNILIGRDYNRLENEVINIIKGIKKKGTIPPLWDGQASRRIANIISSMIKNDF